MKLFGLSIISSKRYNSLLADSMEVERLKSRVSTLENEKERDHRRFDGYSANMESQLSSKDKELIAIGEDLKKYLDKVEDLTKSNRSLTAKVKELNVNNVKLNKELEKKNSEIGVLKKEANFLHEQIETQAKAIENLEIIKQEYEKYKRFENEENTQENKEEYVEDVDAVKVPESVIDEENAETVTDTQVETKEELEKLEELEKGDPLDTWGPLADIRPEEQTDTLLEEPAADPAPEAYPVESANQGKRNKKMKRKKSR